VCARHRAHRDLCALGVFPAPGRLLALAVGSPTVVGVSSVEIRWFFPGPAPASAAGFVGGRPASRVDRYLVAEPGRSVKLRDAGTGRERLEVKFRHRAELVKCGSWSGWCEWWDKHRATEFVADGDAVSVHKTRWERAGVEVVEVDGGQAWSVAVRLDRSAPLRVVFTTAPFAPLLRTACSMGYPEYLSRVACHGHGSTPGWTPAPD
jgi:hypothetical protein